MDLFCFAIFLSGSGMLSSRKLGGEYVRSTLHVDLLPPQCLFKKFQRLILWGAFSGTDEDDDYTLLLMLLTGRLTLESSS